MLICIGILCRGVETLKSALLVNFPLFPRIIILDIIVHITSTSPPLLDDRQFQFKNSFARKRVYWTFLHFIISTRTIYLVSYLGLIPRIIAPPPALMRSSPILTSSFIEPFKLWYYSIVHLLLSDKDVLQGGIGYRPTRVEPVHCRFIFWCVFIRRNIDTEGRLLNQSAST